MALKALIWDVDGTFTENEELHRAAFNATFVAAGLPWQWDKACYGRLLGVAGGRERIAHFATLHDPDRTVRPGFDAFVRELHGDKTRRYGDLIDSGGLEPRPGVARLLAEARAMGLRQAIATSTGRGNVNRVLERLFGPDAIGWFDCIASGDAIEAKKPAPDIYLAAVAGLGVPAGECLAIEDSGTGLRAARAAGVAALVTVSRYCRDDSFDGARAILDGLGEPSAPCRVLDGELHGQCCVDVALLRRWHAAATLP